MKTGKLTLARPREFDPETVLAGAMNVFWNYGYENASLPELLKGMGLTRGSFYKAFTDKKTLFLSILQRYQDEAVEPAVQILMDKTVENGLDRIEHLFDTIINTVRTGDRRGCMLCSTIAAPIALETGVSKIINRQVDRMRTGFKCALKDGGFDEIDSARTSELLITQYVGMRVLVRAGQDVEILQKSKQVLLEQLHRSTIEISPH